MINDSWNLSDQHTIRYFAEQESLADLLLSVADFLRDTDRMAVSLDVSFSDHGYGATLIVL